MIKIIRVPDYREMSLAAARLVSAQLRLYPDSVLGLATGSTPIGMYEELIRQHHEEGLDFSAATTVNLDEYCGLAGSHEQSYRYYMDNVLFKHINIDPEATFVPDGKTEDIEAFCQSYDELIDFLGGPDIQILGVGENGHIAFIEPADHFVLNTHRAVLTDNTIAVNSREFNSLEDVPRYAISVGMRQIMSAKTVIMLASGAKKAQAVYGMVKGEVSPKCPASILQLHPGAILVADEEACRLLNFN